MTEPNPSRRSRVLIVDDTPAIHDDIRKILAAGNQAGSLDELEAALFGERDDAASAAEFDVESAYQGEEALELTQQAVAEGRPYALAFVDMRMPPGWNGVETIKHLWEEQPELQIVICTAYSDYSWSEIFEELETGDRLLILKKPFDTVEIKQLAHTLTCKWSMQKALRRHISQLDGLVAQRTQALETANAELRREMDEREVMETQLRLAQKLESVGQLASGVAHEINTPTQYVGDNTRFLQDAFQDILNLQEHYARVLEAANAGTVTTELLAEVDAALRDADLEYLKEEIPRAIDQALEGTQRIAKIVGAMKEFSHPGAEDKQPVDINRIIENTATVASNEWKYVAELVADLDEGLGTVPGYAAELGQVFLNLIVNAAHAVADTMEAGVQNKGRITVSTRTDGEFVEVRVADTGTGMSPDIKAKIFDPFFTTKALGKGTGQGLAIARSVVVDKHGGTLELETEPGQGSTFIIRLPSHEDPATEAAA